ncbi:hypothetical protein TPHA_0A00610 [Tetrapisispora phaffii CBS 4417]|uniref:Activator of Hsp90 ATPase AHSA1-like N-terminal domain-containing protein n=1 Tax=Tetrapisispora phaffii (strain ATCC 24235 / CBS 4417 / NBRC 1672 / NRRL Y-8282 / UCD 70-5) TaxID=1071381 RepID=G8BML8_TETPH|nr:hypothetical protein TPHA_0A00610 [Tetrapisispora phaffii CBS 4417]CCE61146.1 hypothetical protein TPHA_0A00610 [Tetrapisispora phaffii CBS 4417]
MVVVNPNNWHWVNKNTLKWSEEYFNETLRDFGGNLDDTKRVVITNIASVKGDSNVSQRKGKPICYFDLNLGLDVAIVDSSGKNDVEQDNDAPEIRGVISIPEFMHDEDDFEIIVKDLDRDHALLVNKEFVPQLRKLLLAYQTALLEEHSKGLQQ